MTVTPATQWRCFATSSGLASRSQFPWSSGRPTSNIGLDTQRRLFLAQSGSQRFLEPSSFFYGGLVFIRGAKNELADRQPGMMTLISLAIVVAFVTSLAATFDLFEIEVWWELATLITIMVLGHWLEMRAISQARGALNALAALLPDKAERIKGTEIPDHNHFATPPP